MAEQAGRSPTPPGMKQVAGSSVPRHMAMVSMNLVDLITLDHARMRALYDTYKLPNLSLDKKQMLGWELIYEASQHQAREEMVLYPAMRGILGDGPTNKALMDHQQVKAVCAQLDIMTAADPGYDDKVQQVMSFSLQHFEEEETDLLPKLAQGLNEEYLLQLGIQFEAAKARAPTRPHLEVPNVPPYNEVANAAAATLDLAADQARLPSVTPVMVPVSPAAPASGTAAADSSAEGTTGTATSGPTHGTEADPNDRTGGSQVTQ